MPGEEKGEAAGRVEFSSAALQLAPEIRAALGSAKP
jgi:hypothetical protein